MFSVDTPNQRNCPPLRRLQSYSIRVHIYMKKRKKGRKCSAARKLL